MGEKLPDWESAAKLVKTIANNYKLPVLKKEHSNANFHIAAFSRC